MNNFCRNLSILLAFAIILGTSSLTVFGENSSAAKQDAAESVVSSAAASLMASMPDNNVQYSEDYKFDYSLGLFELLDDDFWKTEQVTKADFAVIVAKMLKTNTDGYPKYNRTPYSDIDNTNYAYPAICYLTEVGILSGDGNSEFRPNDSILVNEASKMIMCALGYGTACEETKGGFPDGYTTFALQQGIYNGIDVNYTSTLSAMQMSRMVRNAMEAYLMENIVYNTDGSLSLSISETKTLLSEIYKIYTATGYVTGTYFSQLGDTSVDLENEVVISDVYVTKGSNSEHFENMIYQTADGIDMESILGYEVNIYFMEDVSGYRRNYISYCEPRKSVNEKHIIPADNIIEFTNEKIVYTDKNDKERTFNFKDGYTLASKNGAPVNSVNPPKEGSVSIVTHNINSNVKAVIVEDVKDALVDRYSENMETIVFQSSTKLDNSDKKIELKSDSHIKFTLNGNIIKPEELLKNDAVTFTKSEDGKYIRGCVSRDVLSDTVSKYVTEKSASGTERNIVTIGDKDYPVSMYFDKIISAGFTSDFQITYDGRIIGTNSSVSNGGNYGYLIKFGDFGNAFDSSFRVKILEKSGKVSEYTSAAKINTNVDGETKQRTASEIVKNYSEYFADAQLVVYETNSAGEIRTLYKAEDFTNSLSDPDDLDFGKYFTGSTRYINNLMSNCAITDATIIFRVPLIDRDRNEDYQVKTKDDLSEGVYDADIYDIRKGIANVVVIKDKQPNSLSNTADTLIVDKLSQAWDEEKQQSVLEVSGWSKGEMISLKVDEDCSQADSYTEEYYENKSVKDLVRGDVIQYNKGSNGYVYTYRMLFNFDKRYYNKDYFEVNQDGEENAVTSNDALDTLFGHVQRAYDFFMVETTKPDEKQWYRSYPTTNINLYVYDVKKDEITIGESYDVEAGDDVFIRTKYDNEQIDMLIFKQ